VVEDCEAWNCRDRDVILGCTSAEDPAAGCRPVEVLEDRLMLPDDLNHGTSVRNVVRPTRIEPVDGADLDLNCDDTPTARFVRSPQGGYARDWHLDGLAAIRERHRYPVSIFRAQRMHAVPTARCVGFSGERLDPGVREKRNETRYRPRRRPRDPNVDAAPDGPSVASAPAVERSCLCHALQP